MSLTATTVYSFNNFGLDHRSNLGGGGGGVAMSIPHHTSLFRTRTCIKEIVLHHHRPYVGKGPEVGEGVKI